MAGKIESEIEKRLVAWEIEKTEDRRRKMEQYDELKKTSSEALAGMCAGLLHADSFEDIDGVRIRGSIEKSDKYRMAKIASCLKNSKIVEHGF